MRALWHDSSSHQRCTGNEAEVGKGIKMSGVPRESFFLTTKLNNPDHKSAEQALLTSLKNLDTPYIDLCKYDSYASSSFIYANDP